MSNTQQNASALDAMLKQYQTNSTPAKFESAKVYDLKNYFSTHLEKDEKSSTKKIRILGTKDGSSPFKEIQAHKAQVEGKWKTFVCLKHEKGLNCPFCEAREALLASGKDVDKELAKKYSAKRMYIPKVIDRDHEEDGLKFWRFSHDYRKQGVLDKIFGVLNALGKDITHPETGRDLSIMIGRDQNDNPIVQSITPLDPSPLSEDKELAAKWLADERTWEDVYAVKPYDYLEIIVKGGVPAYDKVAKKFVDKASLNTQDNTSSEITLGVPNVKLNVQPATLPSVPASEPVAADADDMDLPF